MPKFVGNGELKDTVMIKQSLKNFGWFIVEHPLTALLVLIAIIAIIYLGSR